MGQTNSRKITAQDRAILDLKLQRDKLQQYRRRLSHIQSLEHSLALKALRANDKPRALLALRRKKYQETLLAKTGAQLDVVEHLVSTIEFALVEKDVVEGLKAGNKVLGELRKEMSVELVEKILDESEEARRWQEEVGEMLKGVVTSEEEEEVEEELLALQREATGVKDSKEVQKLPDVPKTEPEMSE
ncbi:hypothetical protein EX30DRAFT_288888, partial [Ascodesmis nigricans]